jgi:S-adenosylmethionine synthetase
VEINAADHPARGRFYLTVTGTSAEAGDDGQVGRGNRVTGVITPGRPMTLEAAAGKNPVSHVGKLYNVAADLIAADLVAVLPDVSAAECTLVSRIGSPIDEPQLVNVRLRIDDGRPAAAYSTAVAEVVRGRLAGLPALSARLITGEIAVY